MYGQTDNGQYTILFWEPIDASVLELRIDRYHLTSACVGIKLYGCVSSEGTYHCVCLCIVKGYSDFRMCAYYLCVYACARVCVHACVHLAYMFVCIMTCVNVCSQKFASSL